MGLRIKFKIRPSHKDFYVPPEEKKLKSIFWNWTNQCNFGCTYCYADSGSERKNELSTKESLDFIGRMKKAKIKTAVVAGGEPLVRKDSKKLLKELNDNDFEIKICTNGYLLDDETLNFLSDNNVRGLQISLDSIIPETYYKMKNAPRGSLEKVLKAIDRLDEFDFHTIVSTVPLKANESEIVEMMDFCYDKGIETFSVYKPIPIHRGKQEEFIEEKRFVQLLDGWLEHFDGYGERWLLETEPPYAKASSVLKKWEERGVPIHYSGCKAAKTLLGVTPEGNIIPCPGLDLPEFHCGNVKKDNILEVWENADVLKYFRGEKEIEGCSGCKEWNYCLGGCRAVGYGLTNRINGNDSYCKDWNNNVLTVHSFGNLGEKIPVEA